MRYSKFLFGLLLLLFTIMPIGLSSYGQTSEPPIAAMHPVQLKKHGNIRIDPYYWLRERENPDVIAYLEQENAYFKQQMAPLASLKAKIFTEIKDRIQEDDASVPYRLGQHFYYSRFEVGAQYPIYARKAGSLEAEEEILLNVNDLAKGHEFYSTSMSSESVSPSGRYLAWAADTTGRRFYTIRILDMQTGKMLADTIPNVTNNLVWANDDRTLFYTQQDPDTLRSNQIYRHRLGDPSAADPLVYEEKDETFSTYVGKTHDNAYLLISSDQTLSTEHRYLNANTPEGEFQVFVARDRGHEYYIDHANGYFYINSNRDAENFRLLRTPENATAEAHWQEIIPHREEVYLVDFQAFQDFLVVEERQSGLSRLRIRPWNAPESEHYIAFDDPAYSVSLGDNPNFETQTLRYVYQSPTLPQTTYDYTVSTRERTQLKQTAVLGGFDPLDYKTERLMVPARDGAKIPVTLVYRQDRFAQNGKNPLLLYGYGAYGFSIPPGFSSLRLSLLDRGFVYAIAHIRGSDTLGQRWYEDGKLLKKKNTFTDFIDVGESLIQQGYADPKRLYGMGGSAGGLLIGAVMNLRPDLFHGMIAHVPFVDVVTTMLDDSIPLTTGEYDEWGNPNDPIYYDYMLSYSPYDNVQKKAYPHLLVTTGLHDSQVQYWEPTKWVAKLRAMKTDRHSLLLQINLDAGHGGASGRYNSYREIAQDYAFLLHLANLDS